MIEAIRGTHFASAFNPRDRLDGDISYAGSAQFSTFRPGMTGRSVSIVTTVVLPRDQAIAAIMMSFCPIGRKPSHSNASSTPLPG
jgi:hypothetical protein